MEDIIEKTIQFRNNEKKKKKKKWKHFLLR